MEYFIIAFEILLIIVIIIFIITGITNLATIIPYVPSKSDYLEDIFKKLKKIKKQGHVFDLGCGDGRTLFIAESNGFTATGYEHALAPYLYSKIKQYIIKSKVNIHFGSMFKANLKEADIIFVYLLPLIMNRIATKIQKECKPGTIIISSGFEIPKLNLVKRIERNPKKNWPCINYYEV